MSKQQFLEDLKANGKLESWESYAVKYGFRNGETARCYWKKYRPKIGQVAKKVEELNERVNVLEGTKEYRFASDRPLTLEEIESKFNVDNIVTTVNHFYNKEQLNGKFLVTAFIKVNKQVVEAVNFQDNFIKFLDTYEPKVFLFENEITVDKDLACLILPHQDAHYNKYDINGNNNITDRFKEEFIRLQKIVSKVANNNYIEEIVYVIGSDQFNAEWTGNTTKGTNQQNLLDYNKSFKLIADYETLVIDYLKSKCDKLKVIYIPGNHDNYVGWHLIKWLEAYYRIENYIEFDTETNNTKYLSYGNSLIMFNHGDAMRPKELASLFPTLCKKQWSDNEHYLIFTGDKHTELSQDINGIKFYRVPQLSTATSSWDDKNGYIVSKSELTAFVITETNGISDIIKEII